MKFIDAHVHCMIWLADHGTLSATIAEARERGLEKAIILAMPAVGRPVENYSRMLPTQFRSLLREDSYREAEVPRVRAVIGETTFNEVIVNFLDTRFVTDSIRQTYEMTEPHTVAGFKSFLIIEDNVIGIDPMNEVLGITLEKLQDVHRQIFELALEKDLPVLYHLDLNYHLAWARELLETYPTVRTNIPHFGYSRRVMDGLLREFPNLCTDTGLLLDHMRRSPDSYREFFEKHPDRVMMGSDSGLGRMGVAFEYVQFIAELSLPTRVRDAVLYENACRFIG